MYSHIFLAKVWKQLHITSFQGFFFNFPFTLQVFSPSINQAWLCLSSKPSQVLPLAEMPSEKQLTLIKQMSRAVEAIPKNLDPGSIQEDHAWFTIDAVQRSI